MIPPSIPPTTDRPDAPGPGRGRATRLAIVAAAGLLGLAALSSFLPGGGGQSGGSPSSSFSYRADGASAWAELLSRFGRPVERLRGDLEPSALDPAATVVVLDAPGLTEAETEAVGGFVRRGGHIVVGGVGVDSLLKAVVDEPPLFAEEDGVRNASPVGTPPAPEVEGVRTVRAGRLGSWRVPGGLRPILAGDQGRVVAVAGDSGSGRVVALADPSPVQNGFLAAEDNAAFALGVVGPGRRVLFAEGAHGYGESEGLAALPRRWRLMLAGLGLAAGIWLYARSRRLGPPEDEARPLPPPRWAYVDAVAGTLARTKRPQEAAEPVRRRARELIAGRAALPPDAGPDDLYQAALRLGVPPDEAAAALGSPGPTEEATVLAAGRALARLTGAKEMRHR